MKGEGERERERSVSVKGKREGERSVKRERGRGRGRKESVCVKGDGGERGRRVCECEEERREGEGGRKEGGEREGEEGGKSGIGIGEVGWGCSNLSISKYCAIIPLQTAAERYQGSRTAHITGNGGPNSHVLVYDILGHCSEYRILLGGLVKDLIKPEKMTQYTCDSHSLPGQLWCSITHSLNHMTT